MPPPTPADLQGFWEMVYLQVENVDALFVELEKMRADGWKVMSALSYCFFNYSQRTLIDHEFFNLMSPLLLLFIFL